MIRGAAAMAMALIVTLFAATGRAQCPAPVVPIFRSTEQSWVAIAGIREQPLPRCLRPELDPAPAQCSRGDLRGCAERCLGRNINACAQLVSWLRDAAPVASGGWWSDRLSLSTVAAALDASEGWFRTACDDPAAERLACRAVRELRYVRYLLGCRFVSDGLSYEVDGRRAALRSGACRGVARLLEDPALSSDRAALHEARVTLEDYCDAGGQTLRGEDTCALAVGLSAREPTRSSVIERARAHCDGLLDPAAPAASELWRQVCSSLIEQRRWPSAETQRLCARPGASVAFAACATFAAPARAMVSEHGPRRYAITVLDPRETRWFDGPIGVALELRGGGATRVGPLPALASFGVGAAVRWHWLEVVAALDAQLLLLDPWPRVRLALDVALQPGVVVFTHGPRRSGSIACGDESVFSVSAGVVLRGGPTLDDAAHAGWIGAVGGYGRLHWRRSPSDSAGLGVQLELTAPTWTQGDPAISLLLFGWPSSR
jgi:hypothetical protein